MALPPSVRSRVEAGENIGTSVSPLLRKEARRSTAAYRLSVANLGGPRTREAVLGAGTFGEVSLQSFAPTAPPVAGVAVPGPTVAVKKSLDANDTDSTIVEIAGLRYLKGVSHEAQLIGVTSRPAEGNGPTALPLIMLAPAKMSLATLITGPSAWGADASHFTAEEALRAQWGNNFPYTLNADAYIPAWAHLEPDRNARRASASAKAHNPANATRPFLHQSWNKIKDLLRQILQGYANLHFLGIVHRDTKPENILITAYNEVQISDFGKCKYLPPKLETPTDFYTGTIWYSSPEVLMKRTLFDSGLAQTPPTHAGWRAHDCWAVGATLYHVLTRTPLFYGSNHIQVLNKIFQVKGTPTSISDDGSVYTGMLTAIGHGIGFQTFPKNPESIIDKIMERAVVISPDFDPVNPKAYLSELLDVAKIINGLLIYDPARRLSIEDALTVAPFLSPPTHLPRPLISFPFSFDNVDYAALGVADFPLSQEDIATFDSWTMSVICGKASPPTRAFIADRACLYHRAFTRYYSTTGREKLLARQPAGIKFLGIQNATFHCELSAMIANSLFGTYRPITLHTIEVSSPGDPFLPALPTVLSLYLEADIPFFGRTYFDDLLASDGIFAGLAEGSVDFQNRLNALGILNLFCYKSMYNTFQDNLGLLYETIRLFVDRRLPELRRYFSEIDLFVTNGFYPVVLSDFEEILSTFDGAAAFGHVPLLRYLIRNGKRPTNGTLQFANAGAFSPEIVAIINSLPPELPPSPPAAAAGAAAGAPAFEWPPTPPANLALPAPNAVVNVAPAVVPPPPPAPPVPNAVVNMAPAGASGALGSPAPNGFVNVPLGRRGRRLSRRMQVTARRRKTRHRR